MTSHAIDREEVMAYVDGALDPSRLAEVETHLKTCDDCRSLVGELRAVSTRLATWHVADADDRLAAIKHRVLTSSASRPAKSSRWRLPGMFNLPRWAIAGAVVVIGAMAVGPWIASRRSEQVVMRAAIEADSRPSMDSKSVNVPTAANAAPAEPIRPAVEFGQQGAAESAASRAQALQSQIAREVRQATDRMVVRTAAILLTSDRFDQIRAELERHVAAHEARVTSLNISGDPSSRRSLRATVGVPAAKLDALLTALRTLGRVQEESLGSDDVTESFRDLGLRTANARKEEQRLVELLTRRTGDLSDVLAVERELARVRLEIERMEAEVRATQQRVDLATVTLTIQEQYRADLAIGPLPLNLRFKNALVDGLRDAAESLLTTVLFILQVAPLLIVWVLLLFLPARWAWRRVSSQTSRP